MRTIVIGLALTLMGGLALEAQQTTAPPAAQAMKLFASSADVTALMAKAKSERKPDQQVTIERILQLPPYNANLEYRMAPFTANIHEKEAEMFYVIEGSAMLVTGGKLVDGKRQNADNLAGSGIEGGTSQAISKGDFVFVPENTAHWFSAISQAPLVLMALHVPRTGGEAH